MRSVYLQRIPKGIDAFLLVRHAVDHLAVLLLILAALVGCKVSDGYGKRMSQRSRYLMSAEEGEGEGSSLREFKRLKEVNGLD